MSILPIQELLGHVMAGLLGLGVSVTLALQIYRCGRK